MFNSYNINETQTKRVYIDNDFTELPIELKYCI